MSQNLIDLYNEEVAKNPNVGLMWENADEFVSDYNSADPEKKKSIQEKWFPDAKPEVFAGDPKKKSTPASSNSTSPFGNSNSISGSGSTFDPLKQELNKLTPQAPQPTGGDTGSPFAKPQPTGGTLPGLNLGKGITPTGPAEVPAAIDPTKNNQGPLYNTATVDEKTASELQGVLPFQKGYTLKDQPIPAEYNPFLNQNNFDTLDGQHYTGTTPTEKDLGAVLFDGATMKLQNPVSYKLEGKEHEVSILDESIYKEYLKSTGLTDEGVKNEINRLKELHIKSEIKNIQLQQFKFLSKEYGDDPNIVLAKYKSAMNSRGIELLTDEDRYMKFTEYPEFEELRNKFMKAPESLSIGEKQRFDELKSKLETVYGLGVEQLFDPTTGQFVATHSASDEQKQSARRQQELFSIYNNKPKDQIEKLRNELFTTRDILVEKIVGIAGIDIQKSNDPAVGVKGDVDQGILSKVYSFLSSTISGAPGEVNYIDGRRITSKDTQLQDLREQLKTVNEKLYSVNRAFMLNVNLTKSEDVQSATAEFGRLLTTDKPSNMTPNAQATRMVEAFQQAGIDVTPEEQARIEKSMDQLVAGGLVDSAPAMLSLMITKSLVTDPLTRSTLGKGFQELLVGKMGKRLGEFTYNLAEGMATYELADQGAATGLAETVVQNTVGNALERAVQGKFGPVMGKMIEYLGRVAAGTIGETAEEFAGQYVQALADNGFDWQDAADKAFGKNMDEFWKQAAVISITSAMMSGVFNYKPLLQGLRNIRDKALTRPDVAQHSDIMTYLDDVIKQAEKGSDGGEDKTKGTVSASDKQPIDMMTSSGAIQRDIQDMFYSPLEKVIGESKVEKLPAKQWLEKYANTEEAKWTGLKEWLEQQEGSVSKSDIQNYLKENRIEIKEVTQEGSASNSDFIDHDGTGDYWVGDTGIVLEYNVEVSDEIPDEFTTSVTVAEGEGAKYKVLKTFDDEAEAKEFALKEAEKRYGYVRKGTDIKKPTQFHQWQLEGEKENYKEILITLPESKRGTFQGDHFNEQNILAHIRVNTRTDADGNKVLFLEEVQSDWGQTGRTRGFEQGPNTRLLEKLEIEKQAALNSSESYRILNNKTDGELSGEVFDAIQQQATMNNDNPWSDATSRKEKFLKQIESTIKYWGNSNNTPNMSLEEWSDFYDKYINELKDNSEQVSGYSNWYKLAAVSKRLSEIEKEKRKALAKNGIPSAPFVTDTNKWTKLALKVALKEAVKQGATKIAWTTGEQQNDRYDLSKQVDEISTKKYPDGTYTIMGYKDDYATFEQNDVPENRLEEYVGKDLAKKIIDKHNEEVSFREGAVKEFQYFQSALQDKYGKGSAIKLETYLRHPNNRNSADGKKYFTLMADADKEYEGLNKDWRYFTGIDLKVGGKGMKGFYGSPTDGSFGILGDVAKGVFKQEPKAINLGVGDATQHAVDITPELIAQVEKGLPLFKAGEGKLTPENRAKIDKLLVKMKKAFPGIRIQIFDTYDTVIDEETGDTVADLFEQGTGQTLETSGGTVYGFMYSGKVVLNANVLTSEVPIHEFGHVWVNLAEKKYPAMFEQMLDLLKEHGKQYIEEVKSNPSYAQLSEVQQLKEALVTAIGKYGEAKMDQTLMDKIKEFFKAIGQALGLVSLSPDQPFKDVLEKAYSELTAGEPLADITEVYPGMAKTTEPMIQYTGKFGRSASDIQTDYDNKVQANPNRPKGEIIQELVDEGNSIPSLRAVLGNNAVDAELTNLIMNDAEKVMAEKTQRLFDRRDQIKNFLEHHSSGNPEQDLATLLNRGYKNFEIYNALIEHGMEPANITSLFGVEYHKTIKNLVESGKLAPEVLAEVGQDAKNFRIAKSMTDVVESLDSMDLGDAGVIVDYMAETMEMGGQEAAFATVIQHLKHVMNGGTLSADDLKQLTSLADVASVLGRMLGMMRGISVNENGSLEESIIKGIEKTGVALQPAARVKLQQKVAAQIEAKLKHKEALKRMNEGVDNGDPADAYYEAVLLTEKAYLEATAQLNEFTHKFFPPLVSEREMARIAKAALSLRSIVVGLFDNAFRALITLTGPIKRLQTIHDSIMSKAYKTDRTLLLRLPKEEESFAMIEGDPEFNDTQETITFHLKDTRNFPVGTIFENENGVRCRVINKSRNKIVAKYIPGPTNGFTSAEFKHGTTITRMIVDRDMKFSDLNKWAKKAARKNSMLQIRSSLMHGYMRNDNLTRQWNEAFLGVNPFREGMDTARILKGLIKKESGKSVSEMTDEEFADATNALLRKNANGELELIHSKSHVIAGQILSGLAAWLPKYGEIEGELVIRGIALSGDRIAYNRVLYTTILQDALAQGMTDPEVIKNYIVQTAMKIQYDQDKGATQLAARQIYANSNWVADGIIKLRMWAISKAREKRAEVWAAKGRGESTVGLNAQRGVYNMLAITNFLLSPFTKIPTNSIGQAIRKTNVPASIALYAFDHLIYMRKLSNFNKEFPMGERRNASQERKMKASLDDLTRRRRILNESFTDIGIAAFLQLVLYPMLMNSGAITPPSGADREKERLYGSSRKTPGQLNLTHFWEVVTGRRNKNSEWKEPDYVITYPNLGILGYGLTFQAAEYAYAEKRDAQRSLQLSSMDKTQRYLMMSTFTSAAENVSLFTQWANIVKMIQPPDQTPLGWGADATEELVTSAGKLFFGQLAPNFYSFSGNSTGELYQSAANYRPEIEVDTKGLYNWRFATRVWTSLSGRILDPSLRSKYYEAGIGITGEKMNVHRTAAEPGTLGAYLQAAFDPSRGGTYKLDEQAKLANSILRIVNIEAKDYKDAEPLLRTLFGPETQKYMIGDDNDPANPNKFLIAWPLSIYNEYITELRKNSAPTLFEQVKAYDRNIQSYNEWKDKYDALPEAEKNNPDVIAQHERQAEEYDRLFRGTFDYIREEVLRAETAAKAKFLPKLKAHYYKLYAAGKLEETDEKALERWDPQLFKKKSN